MSAEPSRGGGASLDLRASHADRDRVVDVLRVAAGDGRLTPEELDERLEAALSARTMGELVVLTTDLPAVADGVVGEAEDMDRIDQKGGSARRGDQWVVPRRLEIESEWGDVTLDFTGAVITHDTLHIDLDMRGGALRLVTRPGVVVDTGSLVTEYAKIKTRPEDGQGVPVALRVVLGGRKSFGRVVVRPQRRGFVRRDPTP
ncbi:DUF1707 SHOCT-like domain-containing protein [Streptomyces guryensis]|uniref:DUF1707 domain-containing protein n=1 Tax=Streptomyces guryensis TaxID=2886947 RepID=A0A9Q3VZJ0_9ACTN|nr:DUF1707 domain-containing protein [Streptomyces guryensis]MCD9880474.1 DUF1707 domain-containing protein [Streptomyces guryensis]